VVGFGCAALLAGLAAALVGPAALAAPVAVGVIVWLCRHPVALLATYLSIGVFKGTPLLQGLPVDPTLALATLLVGVCAVRVMTGRAFKIPMTLAVTFVVLGLLLVLSLTWTPIPGAISAGCSSGCSWPQSSVRR
jgi:hypothetical protein